MGHYLFNAQCDQHFYEEQKIDQIFVDMGAAIVAEGAIVKDVLNKYKELVLLILETFQQTVIDAKLTAHADIEQIKSQLEDWYETEGQFSKEDRAYQEEIKLLVEKTDEALSKA